MIDMRFAPLAMLAAGSFAAPAAASTTVSINFDPFASEEETTFLVNLGDVESPQFVYGRDYEGAGAKISTNGGGSAIGDFVDAFRLPDSSDRFNEIEAKVAVDGGNQYLLLTFAIDGVQQAGTASFQNTLLTDITYDLAPSMVPEPAVWAQLIAGFGLAGSALRVGRRRRSTVNA